MPRYDRHDVVVIGAGQAGISLSYALQGLKIDHVVLERERPFHSWRTRWIDFRANTPNWMNRLSVFGSKELPGRRRDDFGSSQELVEYFDRCLDRVDLPLRTGVDVTKVLRRGEVWEVHTQDSVIEAENVAVCNGAMSTPWLPAAASKVPDTVPQMHSSQYVSPEQITTRNVLVVGSGASGVQISRLLAESGRFQSTHVAQSRVLVLPRHIAGIPIHRVVHAFRFFDVRKDSLLGKVMYRGLETRGDPITRPTPKDLARRYDVRLYGRFSGLEGDRLAFEDGQFLDTDDLTIIWCTGLRGDYTFIHPAPQENAFDPTGYPRHDRGVARDAPGLYFVGLRYQYTSASHDIYGVGNDAEFVAGHIAARIRQRRPMKLVPVPTCCVCGASGSDEIASGRDFEYSTSAEIFHAKQCQECANVYLDPRPDVSEFERIYPPEYHSLAFTPDNFSLVHTVRSRLEARRLLRYCEGVGDEARILDVGCGDGFHLNLLRRYGKPGWTLEGVDIDARAVELAQKVGITIHKGTIEDLDLPPQWYDVVYTLQTVEHVAHPDEVLAAIHRVLKPGGRLVIVTDNTRSVDFGLFRKGYWGGYHFPRHWNLFNPDALGRLARKTGLEVEAIETIVSPVNWVYSIHNGLVDMQAPQWLVDRFSLKSPVSLGVFTLLDMALQRTGRGALLNAYLRKPRSPLAPEPVPKAIEPTTQGT